MCVCAFDFFEKINKEKDYRFLQNGRLNKKIDQFKISAK